jgi:hypothetical protein
MKQTGGYFDSGCSLEDSETKGSEQMNNTQIKDATRLILEKADNGGWVILEGDARQGIVPRTIGAYSNVVDMIDALHVLEKGASA